jgi:hypothetical protein
MHSIDIDASAAQLMQRNVVPQNSAIDISATALDQLCDAVEGALALDESMNFDQDGEARYFGTTSGRLEFPASDGVFSVHPFHLRLLVHRLAPCLFRAKETRSCTRSFTPGGPFNTHKIA